MREVTERLVHGVLCTSRVVRQLHSSDFLLFLKSVMLLVTVNLSWLTRVRWTRATQVIYWQQMFLIMVTGNRIMSHSTVYWFIAVHYNRYCILSANSSIPEERFCRILIEVYWPSIAYITNCILSDIMILFNCL